MPKFDYTAITAKGQETRGVIDAASVSEAGNLLRARGVFPTNVSKYGESAKSGKQDKQLTPRERQMIVGAVILLPLIAVFFSLLVHGDSLDDPSNDATEQPASTEMERVEQKVAADAVQQYEIARRNGTAMDAYVQAGFVAAAYLQAKDEAQYKHWKQVEAEEAARAGM